MPTLWDDVERSLRARAYDMINSDPQVLLETDIRFADIDADLFHARLIGFEDEIVNELWMRGAEPEIRMPIQTPPRAGHFGLIEPGTYDLDGVKVRIPPTMEPFRVAVYRLQSSYVTLSVDAIYDPPVERLRPDMTAKIAFLRYKRRS